MLKSINATQWHNYIPEVAKSGDTKSILVELKGTSFVELEILSKDPVTVNGITDDGETIFLRDGQHVLIRLKCLGLSGLEIVAGSLFSYRQRTKQRWYEIPDQRPLAVVAEQPSKQPLIDLMRQELTNFMRRQQLSEELRSDVGVEELIEDIQNGDLDFEPDIDEFGLPAIDMPDDEPIQEPNPNAAPPADENTPTPPAADPAADSTST